MQYFLSCRAVSAWCLLLHECSKLGPTEFLQGWEPIEVGFDGRLIGGRQVWQALEGAWERQVVGLRLWRQDAAYPIVFWRHIHTYTDTEKREKKKWAGWPFPSICSDIKKKPGSDHLGRPTAELEKGRLRRRQVGGLVSKIYLEMQFYLWELIQGKMKNNDNNNTKQR